MRDNYRLAVIVAATVSVCAFIWMISERLSNPGTDDFPIFLYYANHFLQHGEIYQPTDNYWLTYGPSAGVYKFPPLYGSVLVVLLSVGLDDAQITIGMAIAQLLAFLLSVAILCVVLKRITNIEKVLLSATAGLLLFPVLHDNLKVLQPEPFMLFAICLAVYFISDRRYFFAGLLAGIAAMIKIYPALILIYFVVSKRWRGVFGMATAFVLVNILTLMAIGWHEHYRFYAMILPQLLSESPGINDAINLSPSALPLYLGASIISSILISKLMLIVFIIFYIRKYLSINNNEWLTAGTRVHLLDISIITIMPLVLLANSWWNYQLMLLVPVMVATAIVYDRGYPFLHHRYLLAAAFGLFFVTACLAINTSHGISDGSLQFIYYAARSAINAVLLLILWQLRFSKWILNFKDH